MKKSKMLNIMLTSVMLLSTILTPQMTHALASMQDDGTEETVEEETSETDVDNDVAEEPADNTDDNSGEGESAAVTAIEGEATPEEEEDEKTPIVEEETEDDELENPDNNSPPMTFSVPKPRAITSNPVTGFTFEINENNE